MASYSYYIFKIIWWWRKKLLEKIYTDVAYFTKPGHNSHIIKCWICLKSIQRHKNITKIKTPPRDYTGGNLPHRQGWTWHTSRDYQHIQWLPIWEEIIHIYRDIQIIRRFDHWQKGDNGELQETTVVATEWAVTQKQGHLHVEWLSANYTCKEHL